MKDRTNQATILFPDPDPEAARGPKPYEMALPNGLNSYAIIWERGSGGLIIVERGSVRTVDYSNPYAVKETRAKVNLSPEYRKLLPPGLLWKAGVFGGD